MTSKPNLTIRTMCYGNTRRHVATAQNRHRGTRHVKPRNTVRIWRFMNETKTEKKE